ncbi:uncharacterized protein LOC116169135 [Photinus pyralis]|uniref:uncharacterized protein LOC116169135 n=1 Tax=Photinus pyralis TaxID=7054 RepID=UPI0012677376|nr:uncharacterized protein LOC116169135 [Photinus pyralis]
MCACVSTINQLFELSPNLGPEDLHSLWLQLAEELNACGDGPTREVEGWKKVFTAWKSQTRKKARENKALNALEIGLLRATGTVVVHGISTVPEIGVNEVHEAIHAVENVEIQYVDEVIQDVDGAVASLDVPIEQILPIHKDTYINVVHCFKLNNFNDSK